MSSDDAKRGRRKTRLLIHDYAQELLQQGVEVRQSTLRNLIYERHAIKVSPNLVQDEIMRFWSSAGPAISARLHRPSIPESLCQQIEQLWQTALDSASNALQAELQDLDHALQLTENARYGAQLGTNDFAAILIARDDEIVELRALNVRLGEQVEYLSTGVRHWQQKHDALVQQQNTAKQTHGDNTNQIEALHRAQIEFIQELHLAEVHRLQQQLIKVSISVSTAHEDAATRLEHAENHLMMETARIRDEERKKAERLRDELREASAMLDQLRVIKSKAGEDIAELKGRLQSIGEAMTSLKDENSNLRQQNALLHNALLGTPV